VALPKVESPSDVALLRTRLGQVEQDELAVIAGIETARGVTGIERILAEAAPEAVYFGAEDLAADIGGTRSEAGMEVLYARSHVALHARAAGVLCADQVFVRLDDDDQFERDARFGKSLGYHGKMCLHPRQVPLAHRAFRPTAEEVSAARRILAAYESEEAKAHGGVIRLDGEMVDEPMVRRARQVLASIEGREEATDERG
jgi:citrate lyase subunit beta/citryl-CoA lyase